MKQMMFYALAAVLVLCEGCKRNDDGTTELMSTQEVADKTQETAVKASEVTEKAAEVTKKTAAAVSAVTVQAEDVMSDLNQSVEEIQQKVAAFDKTQLLAYADKYKDVILEKKDQIAELTNNLKGLSITDTLSEKGKALKDQLAQYTDQFNGLKERYSVYLDGLKALGVDLSAYGL
jgi:hypothetical protein